MCWGYWLDVLCVTTLLCNGCVLCPVTKLFNNSRLTSLSSPPVSLSPVVIRSTLILQWYWWFRGWSHSVLTSQNQGRKCMDKLKNPFSSTLCTFKWWRSCYDIFFFWGTMKKHVAPCSSAAHWHGMFLLVFGQQRIRVLLHRWYLIEEWVNYLFQCYYWICCLKEEFELKL